MPKKGGTRRRLAKKVSSLRGSGSAVPGVRAAGAAGAGDAAGATPFNKFNMRNNKRLKHEVAGRKIRGQSSNVPEVRARQENERKSTLLVEYNNLNRANAFVDKRVGELDDGLSKEDKALMRYQRQRQKQFAKSSRFNLDDSDEEGVVETYGQSLGSWDEDASGTAAGGGDGGGGGGGADSDEYEPDEEMGGFRLKSKAGLEPPQEGTGAKTKREILAEVISKNRFYRAQRAQDREEFEDEVDELDDGLDDMMTLLKARSDDARKLQKEQRRQAKEGGADAAAMSAGAAGEIPVEAYDDYDQSRRAMANEARAAASAKRQDNPQTRMKEARQKLIQHERLRRDSLVAAAKAGGGGGAGDASDGGRGAATGGTAPGSGAGGTAASSAPAKKHKQVAFTPADIAAARTRHELEEETNTAGSAALVTNVPFTPDCPQSAAELTAHIDEYCGDSTADLDTYLRHVRIMHSIVHDPQTNGRKLTVLLRLLVDEFVASLANGGAGAERARTLSLHIWKISQEVPLPAAKVFVDAVERVCCGAEQRDVAAARVDAADGDGDSDSDHDDSSGQDVAVASGDSSERLGVPQLGLLRLAVVVFDLEWSGRFLRQVILLVLGRALLLSGRTQAPETSQEWGHGRGQDGAEKESPVQDLWRGLCAAALALDAVDRAKVDESQVDESRDGGELGVAHAAPDFVPEVLVFLHAALERVALVAEQGLGLGQGPDPSAAGTQQLHQAGMLCFSCGGAGDVRPTVRAAGTARAWQWRTGTAAVADRLDRSSSQEAPVDAWTSSQLLRQLLGKTQQQKQAGVGTGPNEDEGGEGEEGEEKENAGETAGADEAGLITPAAVNATLAVLERALRKWAGLPAFPELLAPFVPLLRRVQRVAGRLVRQEEKRAKKIKLAVATAAAASTSGAGGHSGVGARVKENCDQLLDQLQRRLDHATGARKALTRARQVQAVEQYAPAFDETGFNPKKSNDPAADYLKGLKQKARQERKNAARELRRDAAFVTAVRDDEHAKRDLRVKRKVTEAMVFLQNQEATYKQMVKQGTTRGAGSGGGGVKKKKRF